MVTVASLFSQKSYLATFKAFLPQIMQQRNSGQMCKINETTNLTRNADLAICFKQKKKRGNISTTLC